MTKRISNTKPTKQPAPTKPNSDKQYEPFFEAIPFAVPGYTYRDDTLKDDPPAQGIQEKPPKINLIIGIIAALVAAAIITLLFAYGFHSLNGAVPSAQVNSSGSLEL